jgi:UDP-GlcNAc:undecaprenyl-phosphate GlcNAc-1-phosphate transferase
MFLILSYAIICLIIFFLITKISYKLNLVDIPNKRKSHLKPTAFTGGLALCIIYVVSAYLFSFPKKEFDLILYIAFLVGIVGFLDDRYDLNAIQKLNLQIIPVIYMIFFENFFLKQLGDYNYFIIQLGNFSTPFTIICVLLLMNAFNYFDGLDGTLSFASISTFCILIFLTLNSISILYLKILIIPIIIFLFFNFSIIKLPKLFLGDSGSLLLGFITSFTLIYFANIKLTHPILLAFSISIFVYEFISINLIRIMSKNKIFKPGKDHLHHILFKKYKSIFFANFLIFFFNITFFLLGYLSFTLLNSLAALVVFIITFVSYFLLRFKYRKSG